MRDPNRIFPFVNKLTELWTLVPDFRFYQMIDFIGNRKDHFYTEDEVTLKKIEEIKTEVVKPTCAEVHQMDSELIIQLYRENKKLKEIINEIKTRSES